MKNNRGGYQRQPIFKSYSFCDDKQEKLMASVDLEDWKNRLMVEIKIVNILMKSMRILRR